MGSSYSKAYPFPHIIIDNFLPETIANEIHKELVINDTWYREENDWLQDYQVNKFFLPNGQENGVKEIYSSTPRTSLVIDYLNSKEFLVYLEELTGISNLYSDSEFMHGGGIHKINNGGQLSVHLDYSVHPITKKTRKVNLLLYLNPNWNPEWGGNLELWTKNNSHAASSIEPFFNRCVIFTISPIAFHGHPEPMNCPNDVSRYSLALYYFTDEQPEIEHEVVFMKGNLNGTDLEKFSTDIIFETNDFNTKH